MGKQDGWHKLRLPIDTTIDMPLDTRGNFLAALGRDVSEILSYAPIQWTRWERLPVIGPPRMRRRRQEIEEAHREQWLEGIKKYQARLEANLLREIYGYVEEWDASLLIDVRRLLSSLRQSRTAEVQGEIVRALACYEEYRQHLDGAILAYIDSQENPRRMVDLERRSWFWGRIPDPEAVREHVEEIAAALREARRRLSAQLDHSRDSA